MIRVAVAVVSTLLAGLSLCVFVDAGRWARQPQTPPPTLLGHVAGDLLATGDDVALRRGIHAFLAAEATPYGFDNGATRARADAVAQSVLAGSASASSGAEAAQAYDLLGVLAWGGTRAPTGAVDPADRAVAAFANAVVLDPGDTAAAFNLEVALRALRGDGTRNGPGRGSGTRGSSRGGAGASLAGSGY